jgi:hypothetical protein
VRSGELAGASLEGTKGDLVGAMFEIGRLLADGEIDKDGGSEDEGVGLTDEDEGVGPTDEDEGVGRTDEDEGVGRMDGELFGVSVLTAGDFVGSLFEIGRSPVGACVRSIFGV